jgi:hypothetical protein
MRPIDVGSRPGHRSKMPADAVPAIYREPDGAVLIVYADGRRLRIHADGRVQGLGRMERLLLAAMRVFGYAGRALTR